MPSGTAGVYSFHDSLAGHGVSILANTSQGQTLLNRVPHKSKMNASIANVSTVSFYQLTATCYVIIESNTTACLQVEGKQYCRYISDLAVYRVANWEL